MGSPHLALALDRIENTLAQTNVLRSHLNQLFIGDVSQGFFQRHIDRRKACPHHAIDVRGYADFAPLGHSVRVKRDEEKGVIAWRIKFRNGQKDMDLLAPITTKPWGKHIPQLRDVPAPSQEQRDSQLLFNEPKYIRMDDGDIHTLESNGLKMVEGVEAY